MKRAFYLLVLLLYLSFSYAQEWKSATEHINHNQEGIEQIIYQTEIDQFQEHIDSLAIVEIDEFTEMKIETYSSVIDAENDRGYIESMQIPISRIIEVSKFDQFLKLEFSLDDCINKEAKKEFLKISIPEEKDMYLMHAAFKHLKHLSLINHEKKHESGSCGY